MNSLIDVTTTNGQFYYDLFYFIAIVFAGVFFMIDGRRKKYPMAEWSLIFASGIIFFIIGTKLGTYSPDDWKEIVSTWKFPYTERKTILGGIIGGIIGIWIAKKLIRFPHAVLDSFAVSFPVAMAIQRLGCFMVGCCYGTPTEVPWAVSYSFHAHPYFTHLNHGLIDSTSYLSLPVHPNQLYQTFLCLLIAFGVWKLKNVWKRPGNLFFASIALYWAVRFIVEFWRDGDSNGIAGIEWMGIKYVQWGLLAGIILIATFIRIRERKYKQEARVISTLINPVWYFILLCLFVLIASSWFTKPEFFFIELALIPTLFLQLSEILEQNANSFRYRLAAVCSLLFVLIFSGTVTAQKAYKELTSHGDARNVFNDVSLGYGNFEYSHYHSAPVATNNTGCLEPKFLTVGPEYKHSTNVFGGGISHIRTYGRFQKLTLTGEVSGGWDTDISPKTSVGIFDISSSVKYDFRWFGMSAGFHAGKNTRDDKPRGIKYSTNRNATNYDAFSASLRVLPYDIFYAEIRYNELFPYQIGHRESGSILIGSGFGNTDGSGLELGYDRNLGNFISAKALFNNKYGVKATLYDITVSKYSYQMGRISLTYRFDQKERNK